VRSRWGRALRVQNVGSARLKYFIQADQLAKPDPRTHDTASPHHKISGISVHTL